jgi:hypothetical protein
MGDFTRSVGLYINLMAAREQQACFQNHIPHAICNICICSSNFHDNDTCHMLLLDTNFCGDTQIVCDFKDNTIRNKIHILKNSLFDHINNFNKMNHWS